MTDQTTPQKRFRTSCTNCAAAKVKCRATRPDSECLRCRERGLVCVFAPSNRYGRRPSRPAGKCHYYGCPPRDDRAAADAPVPPVELVPMSNSSMDWPMQMQSSSMLPVTLPLDWSLRGTGTSSTMDGVHHTTTRASNGILHPTLIETETASAPPNPPLRGTIFSDTHSNDSIEIEAPHSHNCLAQATEVLVDARAGQDFEEWIRLMESRWGNPPPPPTTASIRSSSSSSSSSSSRVSLLEERCRDAELIMGDVIFTNRKILDHTFSILKCDCARIDYQILVVVSLVWFHLIGKYSGAVTAVTAAVTTTTTSTTMGPIGRHSRDRLTGSVQILMNELRGLAPVIETLSARGAEGRDAASRQGGGEGEGDGDGDGDGAIGASVSVFRQIQDDLTRHLGQVYFKANQLQRDLV